MPATQAKARELVLAFLQENRGVEFKLRELPAATGVQIDASELPEILAPEVDAGIIGCRRAGRGVFYWAPENDEAPVPADFNAAHWADGDVDLYGLIPLEDGGHRMTREMVAKFKRLIAWSPAA